MEAIIKFCHTQFQLFQMPAMGSTQSRNMTKAWKNYNNRRIDSNVTP